jgi:hypothetical protein
LSTDHLVVGPLLFCTPPRCRHPFVVDTPAHLTPLPLSMTPFSSYTHVLHPGLVVDTPLSMTRLPCQRQGGRQMIVGGKWGNILNRLTALCRQSRRIRGDHGVCLPRQPHWRCFLRDVPLVQRTQGLASSCGYCPCLLLSPNFVIGNASANATRLQTCPTSLLSNGRAGSTTNNLPPPPPPVVGDLFPSQLHFICTAGEIFLESNDQTPVTRGGGGP